VNIQCSTEVLMDNLTLVNKGALEKLIITTSSNADVHRDAATE